MGRSPSGLPPDGRGPWSNQEDGGDTQVLPANDGAGTPSDHERIDLQGWLDEGLSPTNAAIVDDVNRALGLCDSVPDERLDALMDAVVGWALVAQGRKVAA
jgi:hypothetical protein